MIWFKPWRREDFAEVHHDKIGFMATVTIKQEHDHKYVADFSATRNRYPEFIEQCFSIGPNYGAMFDMVLSRDLNESIAMLEERAEWLVRIIKKEKT